MPSNGYRTYPAHSAVDHDDDGERRGVRGLFLRVLLRSPREVIGVIVVLAATTAILINALYLQPGPHPAPIFTVKSRPVVPTGSVMVLPRPRPADLAKPEIPASQRPRADIISDLQRELERRGFYDGPVDGVHGPKTDAAIQDFADAAGMKSSSEPTEDLLRAIVRSTTRATPPRSAAAAGNPARPDPIAELIAPPQRRVTAVQRALTEYGYGPIKPTGALGADTKVAIEKFERERKLPITGQVSDRLMRELAAMTGRALE